MKLILQDFNVTKLGYIHSLLNFKELYASYKLTRIFYFQDPGQEDSGLYKCNIKNSLGELNANLTLNIESKLIIFVTNFFVSQMALVVYCGNQEKIILFHYFCIIGDIHIKIFIVFSKIANRDTRRYINSTMHYLISFKPVCLLLMLL